MKAKIGIIELDLHGGEDAIGNAMDVQVQVLATLMLLFPPVVVVWRPRERYDDVLSLRARMAIQDTRMREHFRHSYMGVAGEKFLPWKKAIERQLHRNEQVAKRRLEAAGYET